MTYIIMTPAGMNCGTFEAYSDEEASTIAREQYGEEVLDIQENADGTFYLVVAD
jgi:hypothetical protein